ncbi:unnamed protein product [Victoria cruziana]
MPTSEEPYTSLPTSHLLGSVPAAVAPDNKPASYEVPEASMQIFPPINGSSRGNDPGTSYGGDESSESKWKGVFSISSYTPYFDVDTDIVLDRIVNSMYPLRGNFFRRIETIPDLYGPVWISTTLVFILAAVGNCATYLMQKKSDSSTTWSFDVSYINWAACAVYGYVILLPLAFYFLLQYFGLTPSLIRLWCMWGYSLFIFLPACILLVIPVEFLRWIIILLTGAASACFVTLNIRSYIEGNDLTLLVISSLVLQFALAIFIKVYFFG